MKEVYRGARNTSHREGNAYAVSYRMNGILSGIKGPKEHWSLVRYEFLKDIKESGGAGLCAGEGRDCIWS